MVERSDIKQVKGLNLHQKLLRTHRGLKMFANFCAAPDNYKIPNRRVNTGYCYVFLSFYSFTLSDTFYISDSCTLHCFDGHLHMMQYLDLIKESAER